MTATVTLVLPVQASLVALHVLALALFPGHIAQSSFALAERAISILGGVGADYMGAIAVIIGHRRLCSAPFAVNPDDLWPIARCPLVYD